MENPNPTMSPNPDANQLPEADSLPDGFVESSWTVDQLGPETPKTEDEDKEREPIDYKEEKLVDPNLRPQLVGDDLDLVEEKSEEATAVVAGSENAESNRGNAQVEEDCQSSGKCNFLFL